MKNKAKKHTDDYVVGRGAQFNTPNQFLKTEYGIDHIEGLDDFERVKLKTEFFKEHPKKIINKVTAPDIPHDYSMNPYQGCEHGCVYCYARNTHQYWGYSAGLDFEQKIIIKHNAPQLLEKEIRNPRWIAKPIMLSGNTDCYQPIERKLQLTRKMLKVLLKYRHPVGLITKNSLILRDLDLLQELNSHGLVHVALSITSLDEELRRRLEPRTASSWKRMIVVNQLAGHGIPVFVMVAPVIPGLNDHELPEIMRIASLNGAMSAAYTMVRLNGSLPDIFKDWLYKNYPERAKKVMSQIAECHGGFYGDARIGRRMRGSGKIAEVVSSLYRTSKIKYFKGRSLPELNCNAFIGLDKGGQMKIF